MTTLLSYDRRTFRVQLLLVTLLLTLSSFSSFTPLEARRHGHANLQRLHERLQLAEIEQLEHEHANQLIAQLNHLSSIDAHDAASDLVASTSSEALAAPLLVETDFFDQTLDHFTFSAEHTTYKQRFHVNMNYYKPGRPILLYVGGEAELTNRSVANGFAVTVAQNLSAALFGLEHRYYGVSQPFSDLRTEYLTYLTVEQALEDVAFFIESMTAKYNFQGAPWITIGGSYPGALSALMRLRYPHLVSGSLASSGPVHAKEDFWEYDAVVSAGTGPTCSNKIREANSLIEQRLDAGPESANQLRALFDCSDLDPNDPIGFLYILADAVSYSIQYTSNSNPKSAGYHLKEMLCDKWMLNATIEKDPVDRFAGFFDELMGRLNQTCADFTTTLEVLKQLDAAPDLNQRQWFWQSCLQWGFFQIAPNASLPNQPEPLRSSRITLQYHLDLCAKAFDVPSMRPEIDRVNGRYGGQDIVSSRIFFTNGNLDPWQILSVTKPLSCCSSIDVHVINGTAHCADLGTADPVNDPIDLTRTRVKVLDAMNEWVAYAHQGDCPPSFDNCNGTCIDTQSNVAHCGSCQPTFVDPADWYCFQGSLRSIPSSSYLGMNGSELLAVGIVLLLIGLIGFGLGLHALRKVTILKQLQKMELTEGRQHEQPYMNMGTPRE